MGALAGTAALRVPAHRGGAVKATAKAAELSDNGECQNTWFEPSVLTIGIVSRPAFSVVVPCSRPAALERFLGSLSRADRGPDEVFLVLTREREACERVAARYEGRLPLALLESPAGSPGAARNLAISRASGDWLCFLDDDVEVPPDYFRSLAAATLRFPEAAAIGGPNLTPPDSPLFERCVGHVLASPLAAAGTSARCAGLARASWCDERALILCNLAVRRDALACERLAFEEGLVRNEENLLLELLARRGRKAAHSPRVFVYHARRGDLASFARQCRLSGRGRAEMTRLLPSSLRPVYLAPLALVGALACAPLAPKLAAGAASAYLALLVLNAAATLARRGEPLRALGWLVLLPAVAHLAYALGFLRGLLRPPPRSCA